MRGRIHSIQSLGTVDGPGVRSVVFLQGCALRCPYCHNPDTWDTGGGTLREAGDVFAQLLRFRPYFGAEGGVTVSGGEPLLQADFVTELFTLCRAEGISTALDTSGVRLDDAAKRLLAVTDIVLLDIKYSDDAKYRRYIGVPLETVLAFLREAQRQDKRVVLRQVVTPGVNDTPEDARALAELAMAFPAVYRVELLPFRKLCAEKYAALGLEFPFGDREEAKQETVDTLYAYVPKRLRP